MVAVRTIQANLGRAILTISRETGIFGAPITSIPVINTKISGKALVRVRAQRDPRPTH